MREAQSSGIFAVDQKKKRQSVKRAKERGREEVVFSVGGVMTLTLTINERRVEPFRSQSPFGEKKKVG